MKTLHEKIISNLIKENPELKTNGFKKSMESIVRREHETDVTDLSLSQKCLMETISELKECLKFLPDAYLVDYETKYVKAVEVEVTNQISECKMSRYISLWEFFDYYFPEWNFNLYVIGKYENVSKCDLEKLYYVSMAETSSKFGDF